MPPNSIIRYFYDGDFFKSKDLAKKNAAYKAVI